MRQETSHANQMSTAASPLATVGVVVPCFNEAHRLDPARFLALTAAGASVLFVNDGSTDRTRSVLDLACAKHSGLTYHSLPVNRGKGEAVRFGMLQMIDDGVDVVCFIDADLATPVEELLRIIDHLLRSRTTRVAIGSRVRLMGMHVERSMPRHYLSRLFATFASLTLREKIYDTQCGAKVFRVDDRLLKALSTPFHTRWVFDIELLNRLLSYTKEHEDHPDPGIREVPLEEWAEVPGSKLTLGGMSRALVDLLRLEVLRRQGRA